MENRMDAISLPGSMVIKKREYGFSAGNHTASTEEELVTSRAQPSCSGNS